MKPLQVAGVAIAAVALLLLGISINASSTGSPAANAPATAQPTWTLEQACAAYAGVCRINEVLSSALAPPAPAATPQVVQVEVTVKQEPAVSQVLGVAQSATASQPAAAVPPAPTATPTRRVPSSAQNPLPTPTAPRQLTNASLPAQVVQSVAATAAPNIVVTVIVATQAPAATQTPQPATATNTAIPLPTATPNPCSFSLCAAVRIEAVTVAGVPPASVALPHLKQCAVANGSTAWDCIVNAIGAGNLKTTDFGPGLGLFVDGFYGANAEWTSCACYWEFRINGVSASIGIQGYLLKNGDVLSFGVVK